MPLQQTCMLFCVLNNASFQSFSLFFCVVKMFDHGISLAHRFWGKDAVGKAFTWGNAFGVASAQNLVCCCFDTTSVLKPNCKKKNLFSLSEVTCNTMVCLNAVCLRLVPLHLFVFTLHNLLFSVAKTALSIPPFSILILTLLLLCRTTVNPRDSLARSRSCHFCDAN